ncbi:nitrilase-related carbon-nitrogen hydrolase [Arthrobacter sp. AG367]|uniref:nitrilase-related carbon-nitrogen hydrolase n=1 Tax=Arthrobacter sp. AG367 TaxID=2572909 RepID=UPI0021BD5138|nr:nitrilase-related carbon-nitrogen hydrolase [Arthrobacter sp. AG367]
MTCHDLRFPEWTRPLTDSGVHVLPVRLSRVLGIHKKEQWLAVDAAGAIENSAYVAGCASRLCPCGGPYRWTRWALGAEHGLEPCVRAVEVLDTVDRAGSRSRCSGSGRL